MFRRRRVFSQVVLATDTTKFGGCIARIFGFLTTTRARYFSIGMRAFIYLQQLQLRGHKSVNFHSYVITVTI